MDNDLFDKPHRREVREIPIAPILDMLVAVIFFLLLTGTFIEYTSHTLPPASVKAAANAPADNTEPRSPKLLTRYDGNSVILTLVWNGEDAGQMRAEAAVPQIGDVGKELIQTTRELVSKFKRRFPTETVLQMSFSANFSYQHLISVMDGARAEISNVALISYDILESARQAP